MLPLLQRLLQYLPNAEMTLDLEANEVEVKVLTSLASVAEITACSQVATNTYSCTSSCYTWRFEHKKARTLSQRMAEQSTNPLSILPRISSESPPSLALRAGMTLEYMVPATKSWYPVKKPIVQAGHTMVANTTANALMAELIKSPSHINYSDR